MRVRMVALISLAVMIAGCSEQIEAQENALDPGPSAERPDEAAPAPADEEAPGENVKMQSPVGLD